MHTAVKLVDVDGSTGLVLPENARARLNVKEGDTLFLVENRDGYLLTIHSEEVLRQLEIGREIMKERDEVLRELARR